MTNTYEYDANCSKNITAEATLTDDAAVTKVEITSNKDLAIADDRVTLTANAEVMPSNATVKYQWYVNGKSVKDATSKTYTYTIPKASSDSSTSYKFKCEVTATYKGESTSTMSKEYTVSVSRDYAVSVSTSTGKTSFTVGDKPELEATLTYKGSKVSNPSVTWKIYDEKENSIDSNVATLSASGSTATLTTKAVKESIRRQDRCPCDDLGQRPELLQQRDADHQAGGGQHGQAVRRLRRGAQGFQHHQRRHQGCGLEREAFLHYFQHAEELHAAEELLFLLFHRRYEVLRLHDLRPEALRRLRQDLCL